MNYRFVPGQRVYVTGHGEGKIVTCLPGNGSIAWYFIQFDDGTEDRFTDREIHSV